MKYLVSRDTEFVFKGILGPRETSDPNRVSVCVSSRKFDLKSVILGIVVILK